MKKHEVNIREINLLKISLEKKYLKIL